MSAEHACPPVCWQGMRNRLVVTWPPCQAGHAQVATATARGRALRLPACAGDDDVGTSRPTAMSGRKRRCAVYTVGRVVLALLLGASAASAEDMPQDRGRRARRGRDLRGRARPERRHLQEARPRARDPLHPGRRRDPAGGDLRQRADRRRDRIPRRARRLRQGRADAHHRLDVHRRQPAVLVRAGGFADQEPARTPRARPSPIRPTARRPTRPCWRCRNPPA